MDLNYTPEDVAYRREVRAWLEQNLPRDPIRTLAQRRQWHRKLYEGGYLGMGWPKEYGGGGARPMEQAIVADELARANAPARAHGTGRPCPDTRERGVMAALFVYVYRSPWPRERSYELRGVQYTAGRIAQASVPPQLVAFAQHSCRSVRRLPG